MVGDGLRYRCATRITGISKTEVGRSIHLIVGPLAAIGFCQRDGTFIKTLDDLTRWCAEMAENGGLVAIDGLGIRTQRPKSWVNQYPLCDHRHHQHGVQAVLVTDVYDTVLWVDGGLPGRCRELGVIERTGVTDALAARADVRTLGDRGYRGLERRDAVLTVFPVGTWKVQTELPAQVRGWNRLQAGLRAIERAVDHLGHAMALRRLRGRIAMRGVIRAAAVVICLNRWLHRVPA